MFTNQCDFLFELVVFIGVEGAGGARIHSIDIEICHHSNVFLFIASHSPVYRLRSGFSFLLFNSSS